MKFRVLRLFSPWHEAMVFRPQTLHTLRARYEVVEAGNDAEADALLPSCDAALTGWGTSYNFGADRLAAAPRLRLIAHTAGSVKRLFPDADARERLCARGIMVYSGNEGLAVNVAESTVGCLILALRRWPEHARRYPADRHTGIAQPGDDPPRSGRYLTGATVGLVGLSTVARLVLPLLRPFGCRILAYDPHVSDAFAEKLGVERVDLDDLFRRSDAVSLHAPELPETRRMIGARQLELLRDGAAFVNTARGSLVDHDALYDVCRTGRISAALDVTDPEPLPPDSPLWGLPNVFLLPHIAGCGQTGLFQIGDGALDALDAVFAGRAVMGAVPMDRWQSLA